MKSGRTMMMGTRGSALALRQTAMVRDALLEYRPSLGIEQIVIKTRGDLVPEAALGKIGGKGLFVKEIESALLEGVIDMAVHSMKDMPTDSPAGLVCAAVTRREEPNDVLVARRGMTLDQLPHGAVVGTGSLRRQAQLLACRPDLRIADIRGNVTTRINKFEAGGMDAIILASAGLGRLGLRHHAAQALPLDLMLPAPAQGALCVQVRRDDDEMLGLASAVNHEETRQAVVAERAFLEALAGGCQAPIAAYARPADGVLVLEGRVCSPDGSRVVSGRVSGRPENAAELGRELAARVFERGAGTMLEEIRGAGTA